jgi:zinc/manganese transport system substrate-binding protein
LVLSACGSNSPSTAKKSNVISAIGAENQYANVLSQIGGKYVSVSSVLNNPNQDPHSFEASTSVAESVSRAELIVQNGVGYDGFMNTIESASSNSSRKIITVQDVLHLPSSTPNPHLWYDPTTMPAVAKVIAKDLGELQPKHQKFFQTQLASFDLSMRPLLRAIAAFKVKYGSTAVATTEPVADYLLEAMGLDNRTPFSFQADIMKGIDPAPEVITLEDNLLTNHQVKVFCYNQQVVDSLTSSIRDAAVAAKIPVVAVYETMPTPGYDYQSWMLATVNAVSAAIEHGKSTESL